jgi:hypothetical protein
MMLQFTARWMLLASGICCITACTAEMDALRRETAPVSGRVTYRGRPVEGALVTFVSGGANPVPAFDLTDAEGRFKLTTYEDGDGAVLGPHGVAIVKATDGGEHDAVLLPPGEGNEDEENFDSYVPPDDSSAPVPVIKHLLPSKYSAPETSGLVATISQGRPNEFTFELTD